MRIEFKKSALKDLEKLEKSIQRRIISSLELFSANPKEADIKKLKGYDDVFRLRVGDYRVILEIIWFDGMAFVIRIKHRRDDYQ